MGNFQFFLEIEFDQNIQKNLADAADRQECKKAESVQASL